MKYSVISALIGASSQVQVQNLNTALDGECSRMAAMCNVEELAQTEVANLLQIDVAADEDADADADEDASEDKSKVVKFADNVKGSVKAHYGKTRKQLNAENAKILATQKQCLDFVADHPDHPEVCNWCHENTKPKKVWLWNPGEGVWYKFWGGQYHYWGPSKQGLAHDWVWYQGYWHKDGYVYKYENDSWYRFQGGAWHQYGEKVDISPVPPRTRECRNIRKLEVAHVPDELTEHDIPRCQVGAGKEKTIYEWTDEATCKFVGGKKTFQKNFQCEDGSSEQWREVEVCVQGEKVSGAGFDYATGGGKIRARIDEAELLKAAPEPDFEALEECKIYHDSRNGKLSLAYNGQLHGIPNPKTFNKLFEGKAWKNFIKGVETDRLDALEGDVIKDGSFLGKGDKNAVYLVSDEAHHIGNPATMTACQFDWKKIQKVKQAKADAWTKGPQIDIKKPALLLDDDEEQTNEKFGIPHTFWTVTTKKGKKAGWGAAEGDEKLLLYSHWSKVLSMNRGNGKNMAANRKVWGPWEKFGVIENDDGTVALKAWNGKFVTCQPDKMVMTAYAKSIGDNEKFTIQVNDKCHHKKAESCISFKAANGRFVAAEKNTALTCNRTWARSWEQFYGWQEKP